MKNVYFFNWPSPVGGADTKLAHLLRLLRGEYRVTVVPNDRGQLEQPEWAAYVAECGAAAAMLDDLPERLDGWAISLCNEGFLKSGALFAVKRRGLKVVWSSEMMWHFELEVGALAVGLIDAVLYVSPEQRRVLEPAYRHALGHRGPDVNRMDDPEAMHGWLVSPAGDRRVRWVCTGNYIDPALFPFRQRGRWREEGRPFTVGRLSRPDPDKFPDDFPSSYEGLGLREPVKFRVMGWSEDLGRRWADHRFDGRWELLPVAAEPAADFLSSLDVLVYELGDRFSESWGRAVVEAMLCGVVPLIPSDRRHHLWRLVPDGEAGFHCATREEYGDRARRLQEDPALLAEMSQNARLWAESRLCEAGAHRAFWREVFAVRE